MLRMFSDINGLGGLLLAVIVLMVLVGGASAFDFILTSGKSREAEFDGEDDPTYAFYATKRNRASGVKRVTFDL
ncbi:hypothetical protein CCHL11_09107 [Colletotrichum chlorophyti]|uniref:Uncharacterized protein n=1 Tax=Colletotrichum chlorophyti TaxID=708187 RepID=A0A1Q8RT18_9PEZI|nr:hypothetical protein CCHL11_09107 [Colletotrichum chlorophyti]